MFSRLGIGIQDNGRGYLTTLLLLIILKRGGMAFPPHAFFRLEFRIMEEGISLLGCFPSYLRGGAMAYPPHAFSRLRDFGLMLFLLHLCHPPPEVGQFVSASRNEGPVHGYKASRLVRSHESTCTRIYVELVVGYVHLKHMQSTLSNSEGRGKKTQWWHSPRRWWKRQC